MSITSDLGSDEQPDSLHEALVTFTAAIGGALPGICSYGLTVGDSYVPFDPDEDEECDEDEDGPQCSQAWVRVAQVGVPAMPPSWESGSCAVELQITLEVGVLRCIEVADGGGAPDTTTVLTAALQAMDDMRSIFCTAMSTDVWESIDAGEWTPTGPDGGQFGGTWVFVVVPK